MTRDDMDRVRDDFVRAARWGAECGLRLARAALRARLPALGFLCPLTNARDDAYGGTLENRCRYPLEVFRAMRAVWPADKPMSVRISAHDWAPGGNTPDDAVAIARLFKAAGADLIDVSSGQTTREAKPVYGRMYQTPFADRIRNEVGIATMAVGAIFEPDHVNSILMAGRADLCALARPHLADPYWTLHAAAQLGWHDDAVAVAIPVRQGAARAQPGARGADGRREAGGQRMSGIAEAIHARRRPRVARCSDDHHDALRLWLRLLTCTMLIEGRIRSRLRERFATTLPRFDLMAQLERHPEGLRMGELSQRMMVTGGNVTGITVGTRRRRAGRAARDSRRPARARGPAHGRGQARVRRDGRSSTSAGCRRSSAGSARPTASGCTGCSGDSRKLYRRTTRPRARTRRGGRAMSMTHHARAFRDYAARISAGARTTTARSRRSRSTGRRRRIR